MSGGGARAAYQVGVLKAVARILPANIPNSVRRHLRRIGRAINAILARRLRRQLPSRRCGAWSMCGEIFTCTRYFAPTCAACCTTGPDGWPRSWWAGWGETTDLTARPSAARTTARPLSAVRAHPGGDRRRFAACAEHQRLRLHVRPVGVVLSGRRRHRAVETHHRALAARPSSRSTHLMASSAIPLVFDAVKIHREYFGDGSMRQIAPISPALHSAPTGCW